MRRPIGAVLKEAVHGGRDARPEDSTEESGVSIPIQAARQSAGDFHVFVYMGRNGGGYFALNRGVFFEKC